MAEQLEQLEGFYQGLVENLSTRACLALSREIVRDLRKSQAQRIADQRNPDGSAFEPRKPQKRRKQGRIRKAMFSKIRLNRYLKAKATASSASVEFTASAERIARVHQFGLRDRVSRIRTLTVKYPERRLLGFSEADLRHIEDLTINHLAR